MLKLMETNEIGERVSHCMGVVVTYSVIDRDSFNHAHTLLSILTTQRGNEVSQANYYYYKSIVII